MLFSPQPSWANPSQSPVRSSFVIFNNGLLSDLAPSCCLSLLSKLVHSHGFINISLQMTSSAMTLSCAPDSSFNPLTGHLPSCILQALPPQRALSPSHSAGFLALLGVHFIVGLLPCFPEFLARNFESSQRLALYGDASLGSGQEGSRKPPRGCQELTLKKEEMHQGFKAGRRVMCIGCCARQHERCILQSSQSELAFPFLSIPIPTTEFVSC